MVFPSQGVCFFASMAEKHEADAIQQMSEWNFARRLFLFYLFHRN